MPQHGSSCRVDCVRDAYCNCNFEQLPFTRITQISDNLKVHNPNCAYDREANSKVKLQVKSNLEFKISNQNAY